MQRPSTPKLPIKIEMVNTYLGKTYRVYVRGKYWAQQRRAPRQSQPGSVRSR
jgi:hypothetical protein